MPRMVMLAGAASLLAFVLLMGCSGPPDVSDQDVHKLLYPQFTDMLEEEGKRKPILVDVRTPARFARGHIGGAINIPLAELGAEHPLLSHKRPIILYSDGWDAVAGREDGLSGVSAKKLIAAGYDADRIFDFRGGLNYWKKQGGDLVGAQGG